MNRLRFCFLWILVWLVLGFTMDFLMGTKQFFYLGVPWRREMWRLAHAHGVLLMLVFVVFRQFYGVQRKQLENLMLFGAILVPVGFFLGGTIPSETDPFPAVFLVPIGALCYIVGFAWSLFSRNGNRRS